MSNTFTSVELPDFTSDVEQIKQLCKDANAVYNGTTLYAGIAAMRSGDVKYAPNKSGEGYGWKGVVKAADTFDMSKSEMSKITKVVQAHLQDALECEPEDVRSYVLLFMVEHQSVGAAYDALMAAASGEPTEPKAWNIADAMLTVLKKAVKEGINGEDAAEAFYAAYSVHYGQVSVEPAA